MSEDQTLTPPAAPVAPPRFVAAADRSETVPLLWAIEFDGRVYTEITVRRPDTAAVDAWSARVREMKEAGGDPMTIPLPLYDAPDEVILALDPDDDDRISEVAGRFLPARFRTAPGG